MPKYKIHVIFPTDKHTEFVEVTGYPVTIPELDCITLFAHHPYKSDSLLGELAKSYWNISEAKSGVSLIEYCDGTRKQAVDAARNRLASIKTSDIKVWIQQAIDKHVAEFGIANKGA